MARPGCANCGADISAEHEGRRYCRRPQCQSARWGILRGFIASRTYTVFCDQCGKGILEFTNKRKAICFTCASEKVHTNLTPNIQK